MTAIATDLEYLIETYLPGLNSLTEEESLYKPSPEKWSKKELIGHLVDSAQNNIRRFIVAQYEEVPVIVYNQDKWVAVNNYQQSDKKEIIALWYLLNKQIVTILKNIPGEAAQHMVQTEKLHTIEWLALDYIKHLKYHIHQVLNLEPVVYP